MNHIALFGGGTIVGAALIVVLPEACSIIINAQHKLDVLEQAQDDKDSANHVALCLSHG